MIDSGGPQKDSATHINVSILPQAPLPSRLPPNIEQTSLCYTKAACTDKNVCAHGDGGKTGIPSTYHLQTAASLKNL